MLKLAYAVTAVPSHGGRVMRNCTMVNGQPSPTDRKSFDLLIFFPYILLVVINLTFSGLSIFGSRIVLKQTFSKNTCDSKQFGITMAPSDLGN